MIWAILPAWLKRAVAWALAGLVAIGGAWAVGRRDGRGDAKTKAAEKDAKEYRETAERMHNADAVGGDDLEWLRKRGKR